MNKNTLIWALIFVVFAAGVAWLIMTPGRSGAYDGLASCIADSGATFYGAFWCPHCQNQKAMFGSSARLLPYVECSAPDGRSQLPVCRDEGISSYPTWEFADGNRLTGVVEMGTLAAVTGCALPGDFVPSPEMDGPLGEEVTELEPADEN